MGALAWIFDAFTQGQGSLIDVLLFQLMSHAHYTLRMAFMINEFRMRIDEPVKIAIGNPVLQSAIQEYSEPKALMDFLRRETYRLSPKPLQSTDYGFEFEDHWKQ